MHSGHLNPRCDCRATAWRSVHIPSMREVPVLTFPLIKSLPPRPLAHGASPLTRFPRSTASTSPAAVSANPATDSTPEYLPSLSRQSKDPLPPFGSKATGLLTLNEGLWCLRQDFTILTDNIYLNTHIVQLRDGDLMMVNPPAATEEAVALLSRLSDRVGGGPPGPRVEHVVLPNLSPEHWHNAPDWAAYCSPNATLWVVPGLLQGRSTASLLDGPERVRQMKALYGKVLELPDAGPLPGLEEEVEVATFHESLGLFSESTLWLRDHRAVTFADMAFAAITYPGSGPLFRPGAQITGIYKRLGCPLVYPMFWKDPRVARLWLEQVLSWDVDKILASHLDPWVSNGKEEIRRCFGFVLE